MSEETLGEGLSAEQLASNRERVEAERKRWHEDPEGMEMALRHRCFMDGIDWQHHLTGDAMGTLLFPDEESLREAKTCLKGVAAALWRSRSD